MSLNYPDKVTVKRTHAVVVMHGHWVEYWVNTQDGWWSCITENIHSCEQMVKQYQAHDVPEEVLDVV